MMKIPNINCKHYDRWGKCNKKPRFLFGLFKDSCCEAHITNSKKCDIVERYPKPKALPPPPIPRRK